MIEIITGDLLQAPEQYIAHQCNCVSHGVAGLARAIFSSFPYADCYSGRSKVDQMGTIKIFGDGSEEQRYVISMFAQYRPGVGENIEGNAFDHAFAKDGIIARQNAFNSCLWHLIGIDDLESIAFPYKIGCGLAGGDWDGFYLPLLDRFATAMKEHRGARVVIYQREEDK